MAPHTSHRWRTEEFPCSILFHITGLLCYISPLILCLLSYSSHGQKNQKMVLTKDWIWWKQCGLCFRLWTSCFHSRTMKCCAVHINKINIMVQQTQEQLSLDQRMSETFLRCLLKAWVRNMLKAVNTKKKNL